MSSFTSAKRPNRTGSIDHIGEVSRAGTPAYVDKYDLSHMPDAERKQLIHSSDGDEKLFTALLAQKRFFQNWENSRLGPNEDPVKLTEVYQNDIDRRREELGLMAMEHAGFEPLPTDSHK